MNIVDIGPRSHDLILKTSLTTMKVLHKYYSEVMDQTHEEKMSLNTFITNVLCGCLTNMCMQVKDEKMIKPYIEKISELIYENYLANKKD